MAIDDDIKVAELETKRLEIQLKQKQLAQGPQFSLASAAVLVTVLGGVAAVLFQGLGLWSSFTDKDTAQLAAKSDFNFKGLELFVKEQDHLITCNSNESTRNLKLFQSLFSDQVTASFADVVYYRSQKCLAQSQNSAAAAAASLGTSSQDDIVAAADAARYATASAQASVLAAVTQTEPASRPKYRVFIQINNESDRGAATALQAALNAKGYNAPGIELVSSAPPKYEVRYYNDTEKTDAGTISTLAQDVLKIDQAAISVTPLEAKFKSLPKDTMEFWFPRRDKI